MKRKTVSANYGLQKKASGFVEGFLMNSSLSEPMLVQVSDQEAYELYTNNEWTFSAIGRIIDDCVKVPIEVVPKEKDKEIKGRIADRIKVVRAFFDDPNDNKESMREIREKWIRDFLVYGRGAMEKVKEDGRIKELYSLMAKQVKIKSDRQGNLYPKKTYKLKSLDGDSTKDKWFDKDEVIFVVDNPASHTLYGIKRFDVVATAVATDLLRAAFNSNIFINGAEPTGILSVPGLGKKELKKFRQWWQASFKGANKAHKMAVLNTKDIEFVRMMMTNQDMQFNEYGYELRGKIFAVFGMQPFILGIVDPTTSKVNSAEQTRIYKSGALKPILEKEAYVYTKEIIEDGFGFKDLKVQFASIDLEDAKTEAQIDQIDLMNGVITINERRAKTGRAKVTWGDTPVNIMPGGGQVGPGGNLVPPSGQGGKKPANQAKPPKPTQKVMLDWCMDTFKIHFLDDPEFAVAMFPKLYMQKLLKEDVFPIFRFYVENVKLLAENFEGSQEELETEIDNLILKLKSSTPYWEALLGNDQ